MLDNVFSPITCVTIIAWITKINSNKWQMGPYLLHILIFSNDFVSKSNGQWLTENELHLVHSLAYALLYKIL
jgi:hypothetical protein